MRGLAKTASPATKACARIRRRVIFMLDPSTGRACQNALSDHRASDDNLHTKPTFLTQSTSGRSYPDGRKWFLSSSDLRGRKVEKLSRRRRGNPRSIPQSQRGLRHLVSRLRMAFVLGGDGAPEARWNLRADLSGLRPRNPGRHHG